MSLLISRVGGASWFFGVVDAPGWGARCAGGLEWLNIFSRQFVPYCAPLVRRQFVPYCVPLVRHGENAFPCEE